MGERAGYRVRVGNEVSDILRKQWFVGESKGEIRELIKNVATMLLQEYNGIGKINSGGVALRNDLDLGRLTASLFATIYTPPFDSIEKTIWDISDWGLYEIEMVEWNKWIVWNYSVDWEDNSIKDKEKLAEVEFKEGKTLDNGMSFVWFGGD